MTSESNAQETTFSQASEAINRIITGQAEDEIVISRGAIANLLIYLMQSSVFHSQLIAATAKATIGEFSGEEFLRLKDQSAKLDQIVLDFTRSLAVKESSNG